MPTKRPRIFLTLGEKDEAAITELIAIWGLSAPKVIRKALRETAKRERFAALTRP